MNRIQRLHNLVLIGSLIVAGARVGRAQTPNAVYHSNSYAVSISMEGETFTPKVKFTPSEPPSVNLVIRNISDQQIALNDCAIMPRVWVQGEHGEPPTTYREREATMRLLPGEAPLSCTLNMTYSLAPGESMTKHVLLRYLYDLHETGKYSVYLEFPVPDGWLRTKAVDFFVEPAGISEEGHNL
jgi:hypothetical protein